jgi:high-affinity nickel-transport protein
VFGLLRRVVGSQSPVLRRKIFGVYAFLIVLNLGVWGWTLAVLGPHPLLLGTALLAYGFGLRHAVDADHIAAIDNVTRKLMQEGQRPVGVGGFFAAGHATVVIIAAAVIAATAQAFNFDNLKGVGGLISTSVSALFLFVIAAMNILILRGVWQSFQTVRRGGAYVEEDLDILLNQRGFAARIFRPLFKLITKSWHMFPLGFLFGLGFDTATEVALLGISATQAAHGVSIWTIMIFPALFAAGMALIDTTDGILMMGAYEWAFVKPMRKLYYNLVITLLAVVIAVFIGGVEALGLIKDKLGLTGGLWNVVGSLGENFNSLGFIIIGLFIVAWIGSVIVYRYFGYDEMDVRIQDQARDPQPAE